MVTRSTAPVGAASGDEVGPPHLVQLPQLPHPLFRAVILVMNTRVATKDRQAEIWQTQRRNIKRHVSSSPQYEEIHNTRERGLYSYMYQLQQYEELLLKQEVPSVIDIFFTINDVLEL